MIITKENFMKEVRFSPQLDDYQVNTAAVDLRVGLELYFPVNGGTEKVKPGDTITVKPGMHFLIKTLEKVFIPSDIVGVVYPRSGANRRGLSIDMTGIVDPGYEGHLMIPVSNHTSKNIDILVGERISQIMFHRTEIKEDVMRDSKYHNASMEAKPDKKVEIDGLHDGSLVKAKLENGQ